MFSNAPLRSGQGKNLNLRLWLFRFFAAFVDCHLLVQPGNHLADPGFGKAFS
jgi:hypothetical protein